MICISNLHKIEEGLLCKDFNFPIILKSIENQLEHYFNVN